MYLRSHFADCIAYSVQVKTKYLSCLVIYAGKHVLIKNTSHHSQCAQAIQMSYWRVTMNSRNLFLIVPEAWQTDSGRLDVG